MVDFRGLLEDRSVNAAVAWFATGALVISVVALLLADTWLWAAFALIVVGVSVFPPARTRDVTATLPGELLALVAIPIALRATGLFLQLTPFVTMAGLALLVLLVLDAFTSLEMTPRFAVLFVVVTTMAFAGVWAIAEFAADALLGTDYVVGQREQNLDLVTATLVGVVAGVVFAAYFHETDGEAPLDDHSLVGSIVSSAADAPTASDPANANEPPAGVAEESTADDRLAESPRYRLAVGLLQFVLVVIVGYSIATGEWALFVNAVGSLLVTLLPAVLGWRYGYSMQAGLAVLIAVAATLHVIGLLGPYQTTSWYDTVTHALSSTLVAGVGYAIARSIELDTDRVSFSPRFRGLFLVLFVLAVGVCWEILEFGSGLAAGLVGMSVLIQYGVGDIITDLAFNAVGAILVALWGTPLFRRPARVLTGSVGELLR